MTSQPYQTYDLFKLWAMKIPLFRPLTNLNFALYWLSWTLGQMTQAAFLFALTLQAYKLTRNEVAAGVANSMHTLPLLLFMLLAGVITDRVSRRKTLMVVNILRTAVLIAIAMAISSRAIRVEYLYAASFLFGLGNSFNIPSHQAFMPTLVEKNDYMPANTLLALIYRGALVFGAVIGNELIRRVSLANTFFLLATFCTIATLCLMFISVKEQLPEIPHTPRILWNELRSGFSYTLSVPWLWITIALYSVLNISMYGPWSIGLPLLSASTLPGGSQGLSTLYLASGVGVVIVATCLGQFRRLPRPGLLLYVAVIFQGLGIILIGLARNLTLASFGGMLMGVGVMAFGTTWAVLLQTHVPQEKLGRVASIDYLVSWMLTPLGFWAVGEIGKAYQPVSIFMLGGSITVLIALSAILLPAMRKLR